MLAVPRFCSNRLSMGSIQVARANGLQACKFGDSRDGRLTISNRKKKSIVSTEVCIKSAEASSAIAMAAKRAVRFRPCIDIHKGKVKQIVGSTLHDSNGENSTLITNFESEMSSAEFAMLYKRDGLLGGHVIMLGTDSESISAAFEAVSAYPGGLQVGGGINGDNAHTYLEAGASHVIVTSYVFNNGKVDMERLRDLGLLIGKSRLVLDLSCRKKLQDGKYTIVTDRWQNFSDVVLDEEVLDTLSSYADEFLVHGVDVEGKRLGIDEELVGFLGRSSPIPVTYAGGATSIEDLDRIREAGAGCVDVTVGSALDIFGGSLPYEEVLSWHEKQQSGLEV